MANDFGMVGGAVFTLETDATAFRRGFRDAEAEARRASAEIGRQVDRAERQVTSSLNNMGQRATRAGRALTAGLTAPLLGLGLIASNSAIDFESAFAGVRKTVDGTTAQLAALESGIRNLAKELPASTTEISRVAEAAGQLGIQTDAILGFTRVMIDLGETTNLTADEAATAAARIANVMQLPQDQFDRLGSALVDLGNKGASTEKEIIDFAQRIAGAGKIAGLTTANVLAIGNAFSSVGIQSEAGGTAVQTVLMEMAKSINEGGDSLRVFAAVAGQSATDFAALWRANPAEAFTRFVEGLGRAGDDAFTVLEKLELGDARLLRGFLSLANAGDLLRNSINTGNKAWEENTALSDEAGKRYATTAAQLRVFLNHVMDAAITLGQALMPALRDLLALGRDLLPVVAGAAQAFADLPRPVQMGAIAMAGMLVVAGPLILAFGQLAIGLAAISGGSVGATAMLGGLRGAAFAAVPGFLALAAAIGAAYGLMKLWNALDLPGSVPDSGPLDLEKARANWDQLNPQTQKLLRRDNAALFGPDGRPLSAEAPGLPAIPAMPALPDMEGAVDDLDAYMKNLGATLDSVGNKADSTTRKMDVLADGIITMGEAQAKGLTHLQAGAIEAVDAIARAQFAVDEEAFNFAKTLGKVAYALRQSTDAALEIVLDLARGATDAIHQAQSALFGQPTKEMAGLQHQLAQVDLAIARRGPQSQFDEEAWDKRFNRNKDPNLEVMKERAKAAWEASSGALERQREAIQQQISILEAQHRVQQALITQADKSLLTEAEQLLKATELKDMMGVASGAVRDLAIYTGRDLIPAMDAARTAFWAVEASIKLLGSAEMQGNLQTMLGNFDAVGARAGLLADALGDNATKVGSGMSNLVGKPELLARSLEQAAASIAARMAEFQTTVSDRFSDLTGPAFGTPPAPDMWGDLPAPIPFPNRAVGGPVKAGTPYIVGEDTAELYVPRQDGTLFPLSGRSRMDTSQLIAAMRAASGSSRGSASVVGGSSRSFNNYGTITVDKRAERALDMDLLLRRIN